MPSPSFLIARGSRVSVGSGFRGRSVSFALNTLESTNDAYEIRLNDRGRLDEVVATPDYFHLEQMDSSHWWIGIMTKGGDFIHVNLTSKRAIQANVTEERARHDRNR